MLKRATLRLCDGSLGGLRGRPVIFVGRRVWEQAGYVVECLEVKLCSFRGKQMSLFRRRPLSLWRIVEKA